MLPYCPSYMSYMLKSWYKMHYFFVCALCKLCLECPQAPSNCVQSATVLINTAWSTQLLAALVLLTISLKDNSMRNYWSPHVEVTITAKDKTLIFSFVVQLLKKRIYVSGFQEKLAFECVLMGQVVANCYSVTTG